MSQVYGIYSNSEVQLDVDTNFRISKHRNSRNKCIHIDDSIGNEEEEQLGEKAVQLAREIFEIGGITELEFVNPFQLRVFNTRVIGHRELSSKIKEIFDKVFPGSVLQNKDLSESVI